MMRLPEAHRWPRVGDELQKLAASQLLIEKRGIRDISDELPGLVAVGLQVVAADANLSLGREQQAAHELDRRGFAGPIRPNNRHTLPFIHRQGDVPQRLGITVGNIEIVDFK